MNVDVEKLAEELLKLKDLKDRGLLTDTEFEEQKAKLLKTDVQENVDTGIGSTTTDMQESNRQNTNELFSKISRIELTKKRKTIIIAAVIIALLFSIVAIQGTVLTGDNKIAYELILDASKHFKSPSSVRVVSGTVLNGKDSSEGDNVVWCGISAINGFGVRSTSYYYISEDGTVMETDYSGAQRQDINVDKINKKLEKKLKY